MTDDPGADARLNLAVLFTAFDADGDELAAPVVRELASRAPELALHACGGAAVQAAGARLLERTVESGGAAAAAALFERLPSGRRLSMLGDWAAGHRVAVHVAVGGAAENRPVARAMRAAGARVVHLGAPPLREGGRLRAARLRRVTSMVLCTLPYEEEWFRRRDIPARFIGHPSINRAVDVEALRALTYGLPQGAPRLALLPGRRAGDIRANMRLLGEVYAELQARHAGLCGVIVADAPEQAQLIKRRLRVFPTGLHLTISPCAPVVAWSDLVFVTGAEAAIEAMVQRKPMIGVSRSGLLAWLAARFLPGSGWRLLPNMIAEHEVVPEFIPHVGGAAPIVRQATRILLDSKRSAIQAEELHRVCLRFANHRPAEEAARAIVEVLRSPPETPPARSAGGPAGPRSGTTGTPATPPGARRPGSA
jgi:lipid-A-disaccharide synthase